MKLAMSTILALLAALIVGLGSSTAEAVNRASVPSWPGHQPGEVLLGMSCGNFCAEKERELGMPFGVHRQFSKWGDWSSVVKKVRASSSSGRVPWVSIEGPQLGSTAGWEAMGNNVYDAETKALAGLLKANDDKPIILTFHHEPSNDGTEQQGVLWARAYNRFCDILEAEGALANVSCVPILGDWLFNPANKRQDPDNWVLPSVLKRADFLGIDVYENPSGVSIGPRLQRVIDWMAARGFPNKMVGVGEMGATDAAYAKKSAVDYMNESFGWA